MSSSDLLLCYSCKDHRPASMFHKNHTRKRGYTDKCKECYKLYQRDWYLKNKQKVNERSKQTATNINQRYTKSKHAAIKIRKIDWSITLEEFTNFNKLECFYCDGYFGKVSKSCGLDRIDNNKGYHKDNVLSCCEICNKTRSNIFTVEETKLIIETVIKFRENKNE